MDSWVLSRQSAEATSRAVRSVAWVAPIEQSQRYSVSVCLSEAPIQACRRLRPSASDSSVLGQWSPAFSISTHRFYLVLGTLMAHGTVLNYSYNTRNNAVCFLCRLSSAGAVAIGGGRGRCGDPRPRHSPLDRSRAAPSCCGDGIMNSVRWKGEETQYKRHIVRCTGFGWLVRAHGAAKSTHGKRQDKTISILKRVLRLVTMLVS
jgi:hypothetical protein